MKIGNFFSVYSTINNCIIRQITNLDVVLHTEELLGGTRAVRDVVLLLARLRDEAVRCLNNFLN